MRVGYRCQNASSFHFRIRTRNFSSRKWGYAIAACISLFRLSFRFLEKRRFRALPLSSRDAARKGKDYGQGTRVKLLGLFNQFNRSLRRSAFALHLKTLESRRSGFFLAQRFHGLIAECTTARVNNNESTESVSLYCCSWLSLCSGGAHGRTAGGCCWNVVAQTAIITLLSFNSCQSAKSRQN